MKLYFNMANGNVRGNGVVHKYEEIIKFYKSQQNMEESRKYQFDFTKYAPNNYTIFLNTYTLDILRDVARMCKDNAKIYGQVYWSIQNAQKIRLSANKETTIFTLHNYFYYKYVALHTRLARPRNNIIYSPKFVYKIKNILNKWVVKAAKQDITNVKSMPTAYKMVAIAAAKASDKFRKRINSYKHTINVELQHMDYDLEEYEYQLQNAENVCIRLQTEIDESKEKKLALSEKLEDAKKKEEELLHTLKEFRFQIGENIKEFIYTYSVPHVPEEMENQIIQVSNQTEPTAYLPIENIENMDELKIPITYDRELEYILCNIPLLTIDKYFSTIREYSDIKICIRNTMNTITETCEKIVDLVQKLMQANLQKLHQKGLFDRMNENIKIMEEALIRKRKFPLTIVYEPEEPYESNEGTVPSPPQCPICLEDSVEWATTNCNHTYCRGCICKSLNSIVISPLKPYICALCRTDVTSLKTADRNTKYQLEIKYVHTSCYI